MRVFSVDLVIKEECIRDLPQISHPRADTARNKVSTGKVTFCKPTHHLVCLELTEAFRNDLRSSDGKWWVVNVNDISNGLKISK